MRTFYKFGFWGVLAAVPITIASLFSGFLPGGDGVLAARNLPDGSEYIVTQRYNGNLEPYTVSFFMRPPQGKWGWCYIDHEALRWRKVTIDHDMKSDAIMVRESGILRCVLNRRQQTFWLDNGSFVRTIQAPQRQQEPDFAFRFIP